MTFPRDWQGTEEKVSVHKSIGEKEPCGSYDFNLSLNPNFYADFKAKNSLNLGQN